MRCRLIFDSSIFFRNLLTITKALELCDNGPLISLFLPLTPSHLVTLYNCSMGREDCSLCKNADPKYSCVWCAKQKACVYEKLCSAQQGSEEPHNMECPDPQITDVSTYCVVVSLCPRQNWKQ